RLIKPSAIHRIKHFRASRLCRSLADQDRSSRSRSCKLCASRRGQSPLSCSFHFIGLPLTAVFRDQPVRLIAALAPALAAFDAPHSELAFDVAENELAARHWERG